MHLNASPLMEICSRCRIDVAVAGFIWPEDTNRKRVSYINFVYKILKYQFFLNQDVLYTSWYRQNDHSLEKEKKFIFTDSISKYKYEN
jgi:hypothetical protein